jgi:chaperonin GroEL (HSP60 family)
MGLHTNEIILGYKKAADKLYELLSTLTVRPFDDPKKEEELSRVIKPVVMVKQCGMIYILTPLISNVCHSVMHFSEKSSGELTLSPDVVRVVKIIGGSVSASMSSCGIVIPTPPEMSCNNHNKIVYAKIVVSALESKPAPWK